MSFQTFSSINYVQTETNSQIALQSIVRHGYDVSTSELYWRHQNAKIYTGDIRKLFFLKRTQSSRQTIGNILTKETYLALPKEAFRSQLTNTKIYKIY